MEQILKVDYLTDNIKNKNKNDTGMALDVLPFLTKRTQEIRKSGFNKVLGEFIRKICEVKLDEKSLKNKELFISSEDNILSEHMADSVEFDNEDDKYDFIRFLSQYLFNQEEIKPVHPYIFNFIKVDKKLNNEFGKYASFMYESFVKGNQEIKNVFGSKETEDILTELVLSKMDVLEEQKNKQEKEYQPLLPAFTSLYQEDLLYLSKYKDYFLTSFPLLTHYYVFMYACQLILKFEQFTEADFQKVQPLYFALEMESISKRRKAADELEGFKFIKDHSINLFRHIHTISHLSHNIFNDDLYKRGQKIPFMPYSELNKRIKENGEEFEESFFRDVKQWIYKYQEWSRKKVTDDSNDLESAFKVLFNCLKAGMNAGVCEKYGKNIEDLGAGQFIKSRGSLGQILNIKHDFLLLLTAVSVKDKRIPLNELFVEFEKRGLAFDRYSKKEIITLFDNLNILDKKSDSGDAQYVKPIL
ncbi:DNA phosphorothioation-dependent restriction protein DptG [Peribacillus deserti]|uniref:DNA phosphorothioation-dependent restriction protein DptG n=1 Tax=Peribacillus deserti TaxID=673318 RepID=A0ABS2QER4_9BACI|nr:DNA phosphorothioation-dependent restriction protein DptG [Peribacillus deserti]MBM7691629.1 DNA phosphorothioation-dependent restriction protein DptG [Peribacillus deserti]